MRFFSYGRKSVFSDKSDSIDNQFRMNREYCESKFSGQVDSWQQFSDEDFTGANTSRPDLQRMLSFIKGSFCDVLVVYQLDRLSRDVRDFANIYALLEEHGVMFISIKENIDTTTPIGRAMMYVTVVFAQNVKPSRPASRIICWALLKRDTGPAVILRLATSGSTLLWMERSTAPLRWIRTGLAT